MQQRNGNSNSNAMQTGFVTTPMNTFMVPHPPVPAGYMWVQGVPHVPNPMPHVPNAIPGPNLRSLQVPGMMPRDPPIVPGDVITHQCIHHHEGLAHGAMCRHMAPQGLLNPTDAALARRPELLPESTSKTHEAPPSRTGPVQAETTAPSSDVSDKGDSSPGTTTSDRLSQFECPICCHVLRNTQSTKCGHLFCKQCLKKHIEYFSTCAVCRVPLSRKKRKSNHPLFFPAPYVDRQIRNIQVTCKYTGCSWKGIYKNLKSHEHKCVYREVSCYNCNWKGFKLNSKLHFEQCLYKKTQCPSCGIELQRFQLEEHRMHHCPKEQYVRCPYAKYGCTSVIYKDGVAEHVKHFEELHRSLKAGWLMGQLQAALADKNRIMRKLKQKKRRSGNHSKRAKRSGMAGACPGQQHVNTEAAPSESTNWENIANKSERE